MICIIICEKSLLYWEKNFAIKYLVIQMERSVVIVACNYAWSLHKNIEFVMFSKIEIQ